MDKKINTIINWGIDNIYKAVMAGEIKTFDGVIKVMQAVTPLVNIKPQETEKDSPIAITQPTEQGGL